MNQLLCSVTVDVNKRYLYHCHNWQQKPCRAVLMCVAQRCRTDLRAEHWRMCDACATHQYIQATPTYISHSDAYKPHIRHVNACTPHWCLYDTPMHLWRTCTTSMPVRCTDAYKTHIHCTDASTMHIHCTDTDMCSNTYMLQWHVRHTYTAATHIHCTDTCSTDAYMTHVRCSDACMPHWRLIQHTYYASTYMSHQRMYAALTHIQHSDAYTPHQHIYDAHMLYWCIHSALTNMRCTDAYTLQWRRSAACMPPHLGKVQCTAVGPAPVSGPPSVS